MAQLFETTSIGSLELHNRSVRSATWSGVGDSKGHITDLAEKIYGELARGDIGLIITGYQYIMTNGAQLPFMVGNYSDDLIPSLTRYAAIAHENGTKIIPQLVHCGLRANPKLFKNGEEIWAPSIIPGTFQGQPPKEVGKAEIELLVEAYASAAARSKKAGFDGIQLHGAHGYGINQFISPALNRRTDAYGGSAAKRYRFLGEVLEAVKSAVGDDFPVLIKLNGHDFMEGGLIPEESLQIAKRLQDDGISAIEVSGGSSFSPEDLGPVRKNILKPEDEGYFLDIAAFFKESIRVPIIAVGGIRSPKTIQDIFDYKKADFVSFSRPFIREPHFIQRLKEGDTRRSSCISCNGCFESGLKGTGVSCKVTKKESA